MSSEGREDISSMTAHEASSEEDLEDYQISSDEGLQDNGSEDYLPSQWPTHMPRQAMEAAYRRGSFMHQPPAILMFNLARDRGFPEDLFASDSGYHIETFITCCSILRHSALDNTERNFWTRKKGDLKSDSILYNVNVSRLHQLVLRDILLDQHLPLVERVFKLESPLMTVGIIVKQALPPEYEHCIAAHEWTRFYDAVISSSLWESVAAIPPTYMQQCVYDIETAKLKDDAITDISLDALKPEERLVVQNMSVIFHFKGCLLHLTSYSFPYLDSRISIDSKGNAGRFISFRASRDLQNTKDFQGQNLTIRWSPEFQQKPVFQMVHSFQVFWNATNALPSVTIPRFAAKMSGSQLATPQFAASGLLALVLLTVASAFYL
ncbi:hypothetical protein DFS34DRAFT_597927 [Phlyctochytrium arcticum]|nr:hypothetical protein DFS34DRAFT_597927 [Phlyctochytrium arcticum]